MPRPVNVYCEWGLEGIRKLSPVSDVFIIVDVLSFSTCVDIAAGNKAFILPYKFKDESASNYASINGAELAAFSRSRQEFSLSPSSLTKIKPGTKLVLPSPNGS
jgi:2-phosphosulfolactate phosphatase